MDIRNSRMKAKAVCVMRTDLRNSDGHKVPKGKLIAQGGHAFVGLLLKKMVHTTDDEGKDYGVYARKESPLYTWIEEKFTKIVLAVDSEEELAEIYFKAMTAGLNVVDIVDNGETEFGKPTFTCIGIGPAWSEDIDKITGHLKLFQ
jgi:PTH2 family peptidyl-tRNA hydrolase